MAESFATTTRVTRPVRLTALVIALAALALATRTTITSLAWVGVVFPGFFLVEDRLIPAIGLPHWSGTEAHDLYLSQVVAVDGTPVAEESEIYGRVALLPVGTKVNYTLRRGAHTMDLVVRTERLSGRDWILLFGSYLWNGIVFLGSGLLAWSLRPRSPLSTAFLAFGASCALFLFTAMDYYGPATFQHLNLLANALVPASALQLAFLFPEEHRWARLRFFGYGVAAIVFALYEVLLRRPELATIVFMANTAWLGLVGAFFGSRLLLAYFRSRSLVARQRVRVVLLGTLVGLTLPGAILLSSSLAGGASVAQNTSLFAFFIFPLSLAYAIVQHDFFEIDAMVKRGATYLFLTAAVGAAYVAAVVLFNFVLRLGVMTSSPVFAIVFTLAVLLLFDPLRTRAQALVDRVFFNTRYDGARILATAAAELSGALRVDAIVRIVRDAIGQAMPGPAVRLFLDEWPGAPEGLTSGPPTSSMRSHEHTLREPATGEAVANELRAELEAGRLPTAVDPPSFYADATRHAAVRAELLRIGVEIAVPMLRGDMLAGFLAVGPKRSGLFYTAGDAEFLRALAQQAAIAVQNASSYEELVSLNASLEERVHERTAELEASNGRLADSNRRLEDAYAELKSAELQLVQSEKLASLGRLAAGVAHEINNPVSFIAANITPLRERLDHLAALVPADGREALDEAGEIIGIMARGADRTARIVADLRTFSRLGEAPRKAADLAEAIEVTIRLLEPRWRGRIEIHRDVAVLPAVECDVGQVNQVLMNLLANACDAIASRGNVWITARAEAEGVEISVRDDGCGIPPERLERIFDPFFTTKDVGKGTGLGLSIAHGIAVGHGGSLTAASEVGVGSMFRLRLPLRAAASPSPRA